MADYVIAIDQGTTSTRAIIFDQQRHRSSRRARWSTSRSSRRPAGSSTTPLEIWHNTREVIGQALVQGEPHPARHRRRRHHQPARDRGRLGQDHRRADLQRHRLAGHPHPADRRPARGRRRRRALQAEGRAAAGDLLLRHEDRLDPRERRGRPRTGRGRRPALRHDRLLGALEPHRRRRRRRARHRRHQRQPHDVHGPRDASLGRRHPRRVRRAPLDDARHPKSSSEVYGDGPHRRACCARCRSPASSATSRRRRSARRRSTPARRRTPTARATSSSSTPARDRALQERAAHHGRLQARRRSRRTTRWRAPIAVTGSLVQWLRDNLGLIIERAGDRGHSRRPSRTTAACTSCRRSPACSRRTGAPTPAARWWA